MVEDTLKVFVPLYENSIQIMSIEHYITNYGYKVKVVIPIFDKMVSYKKLRGFLVCLH